MEFTKEEKKAIERIKLFEYRYTLVQNDDKVVEVIINLIEKQQKEIEKYKRYFKLAISDLQSEGYMQMPFKNIENYYSKREDIV